MLLKFGFESKFDLSGPPADIQMKLSEGFKSWKSLFGRSALHSETHSTCDEALQKKKKRGRLWCNGEQGLSCLGLDFTVMKMFECCWSVKLPLLTASPTFEHDEITSPEQAVWTASQWYAAAGKITEKWPFRVIHGLNQVCILKDVISLTYVTSYCFVKGIMMPSWDLGLSYRSKKYVNLSHRMCVIWFTTTYLLVTLISTFVLTFARYSFLLKEKKTTSKLVFPPTELRLACIMFQKKKLDPNAETEAGGLTTKSALQRKLSKNRKPKISARKDKQKADNKNGSDPSPNQK